MTPETTCTLAGYADVLVRALEELEALDALLVGWSLGGHIVLEAAPRLPRARGYFLFGAPPIATAADFQRACHPAPSVGALFRASSPREEVEDALALFVRPGAPVPGVFVEDFFRADGHARGAPGASVARDACLDEQRIVAELGVPVAVVHGAEERLIRRDYLDEVSMPTLWRGAIQEVPDAGHAPHWENPAAFNRLLRDFARDCGLLP